jgi:hypothetical protein
VEREASGRPLECKDPALQIRQGEVAHPRPLPVAPEDIECLVVNHKSDVEDVKTFLNQGLNGDAEEIEVRTFQGVKEDGVE